MKQPQMANLPCEKWNVWGVCCARRCCQIGKKYYENLTPEKMDEILGMR